MKKIRKKSKKNRISLLPITILSLGLIGIGFFPFKTVKKIFGKKKKRRALA